MVTNDLRRLFKALFFGFEELDNQIGKFRSLVNGNAAEKDGHAGLLPVMPRGLVRQGRGTA